MSRRTGFNRWRKHFCERAREGFPAVVFLLVLVLSHYLPGFFAPDTAQFPLQAAMLQLAGVLTTAGALLTKGRPFGAPGPLEMIRAWFERTLSPPEPRHGGVDAESGKTVSEGLPPTVQAGKNTLEERVAELENTVREIRGEVANEREARKTAVQEIRQQLADLEARLDEKIKGLSRKTEEATVGHYTWEWVGLGWILAGLSIEAVALAIRGFTTG